MDCTNYQLTTEYYPENETGDIEWSEYIGYFVDCGIIHNNIRIIQSKLVKDRCHFFYKYKYKKSWTNTMW